MTLERYLRHRRAFEAGWWALFFLVNKYFEYADHFQRGELPSHSTFLAIYYTLTGLHGLHILGGVVVMGYFLGPGAKLWKRDPEMFTNRIEYTGRGGSKINRHRSAGNGASIIID